MSRLGDRLRRHAREAGAAPAVHDGERWWSYGELVAAADALALDAGPGDVVAVAIDRGITGVAAIAAVALAGAIPALIDPRDRELARRTLVALRPACVLVEPGAGPGDEALPGARVVELGAPIALAGELAWQPQPRSERIAHILFTSGSTANGKGVVWSELRAGYDWLISAPPVRARSLPSGIVVPLCTSLGYHELVRSLFHGTAIALLDAPFPAAIAQAQALGVDRLKLTPTHVELLLSTAEAVPGLRAITVAAAPIAPDRLRALAARLPGARICRSYGLTETGVATMVWLHKKPNKLHTVGRPVSFRRVTVRDEHGRMLPPGTPGEVVIELPVWDAVDGYLDAPPELARRFDNGALWTGDRGTIDDHGFVVLASRAAEILKIGGRSVGAPRIEDALGQLPEVAEVAVVGVPDRVLGEVPCAMFVPPAPGAAGDGGRRLVDGGAAAALRADEVPRWYLARRELPRGASGKLRRGVLGDEAARWTQAFAQAVVPEHRPYPAFELEHGIAVVDGCPAAWADGLAGLDPHARLIALVARRPMRLLALAAIQAGAHGVPASARFVVGPVAAPPGLGAGDSERESVSDMLLDVFAGELILLAGLLPGARAEAIYAHAEPVRPAFAGAGFVALAGAPGWLVRREAGAAAAEASSPAQLADVGATVRQLASWAGRVKPEPSTAR